MFTDRSENYKWLESDGNSRISLQLEAESVSVSRVSAFLPVSSIHPNWAHLSEA